MAEFDIAIFARYAQKRHPDKLPPNVYFSHTEYTVTVFDAFPKSHFHLLVLPRVGAAPFIPANLLNLHRLLNCHEVTKDEAEALLQKMKEDAEAVKVMVEEEMIARFGFKWDVWMGFHAAPSLEHLHLHVISSDLCGEYLKKPHHYNSYHPKLGYFLHIDDVLSWFGAVDSIFDKNRRLKKSEYRGLLNSPMNCFQCCKEESEMRKMRDHLKARFEKITKEEKAKAERRRKFEEAAEQRRRKRLEMEKAQEEILEGDAADGDVQQTGEQGLIENVASSTDTQDVEMEEP